MLWKLRVVVALAVLTSASILSATPASADPIRDKQWYLRSLNIVTANRLSAGVGEIVAVVDTGIDPHPDLHNNLLRGISILPGAIRDGREDPDGHGTEMASLIAGHGRPNQSGIVGIAPSAKLLPVRTFDVETRVGSAAAAAGIEWAARHGANIINFSGAVGPSLELQSAVGLASAMNVLVVAAAGNKGQDITAAYPASMRGVLAVGASDRLGNPAELTRPSPSVQLCAPGVDIESAFPGGKYWNGSGTSEATAIVSGAAALVRAKFPQLSAQEVIHRLTATATDIGEPGRDDECGYGVLNIVKALTADVPPLIPATKSSIPQAQASTPSAGDQRNGGPALFLVAGAVAVLIGVLAAVVLRRRGKSS